MQLRPVVWKYVAINVSRPLVKLAKIKAEAAHHGESCAGDINPPLLLSRALPLRHLHTSVCGTKVEETLNKHAFQSRCICTEGPGRLQGEFYTATQVASLSSLWQAS